MTEMRVGRLLAACLHQAVVDVVPQRLDFYEEWLRPDGLRDGTIGLAPITAVIGFLRTEPEGIYDRVVSRAGTLAAEWTVASLPLVERRVLLSMPRWLRTRGSLRVARRIIRDVFVTSAASARVRRGAVRLQIRRSLFCTVRERQAVPLCGFYAAVGVEALRRFGIAAHSRIDHCMAMEGSACVLTLELPGRAVAPDPAMAA